MSSVLVYRWRNPFHWAERKFAHNEELLKLLHHDSIDHDTIQDVWQDEMEKDGYFIKVGLIADSSTYDGCCKAMASYLLENFDVTWSWDRYPTGQAAVLGGRKNITDVLPPGYFCYIIGSDDYPNLFNIFVYPSDQHPPSNWMEILPPTP